MITLPFPATQFRIAFLGFAGLLFIGTHWPKLRIEAPVERPDLYIHFGVFGMWALLLSLTGWLGKPGTRINALRCFGVGVVYAAIDESLQLIPALHRFAAWDDYLFNVFGLAIGVLLGLIVKPKP